jgi:hypothetical protein
MNLNRKMKQRIKQDDFFTPRRSVLTVTDGDFLQTLEAVKARGFAVEWFGPGGTNSTWVLQVRDCGGKRAEGVGNMPATASQPRTDTECLLEREENDSHAEFRSPGADLIT